MVYFIKNIGLSILSMIIAFCVDSYMYYGKVFLLSDFTLHYLSYFTLLLIIIRVLITLIPVKHKYMKFVPILLCIIIYCVPGLRLFRLALIILSLTLYLK